MTSRCLRLVPARRCLSWLYTWNLSPPTLLPRQAAWSDPVGARAARQAAAHLGELSRSGQSEPTVIVCLHCDRASNQIAFAAGVRAAHGRARRAGVRNTGCGRGACGRPRGARPRGARAAAEGCGRLQGAQAAAGRVGGVRGGARRRRLSARAAVGRAGGCGACGRQ